MSTSAVGRVVAVGLGPAGPELVPPAALQALGRARRRFVRTRHHPAVQAAAADAASELGALLRTADTLDHHYEQQASFEAVYAAVAAEVADAAVAAAAADPAATVAYAVPGSPLVAERTVELLRADPRIDLQVVPALSFLDLAWERLGVDPLAAGVRLVDATDFAVQAAGERGPLLVAQCYSRSVLSDVKLAVDDVDGAPRAVLLHHLGLPDEQVLHVAWADIDRSLHADHLTSLWVPELAAPVGAELVRLDELVRVLRARCPWDMRQTHESLARHLLEESYEVLDAIEELTPQPGPAGQPGPVEEPVGQPATADEPVGEQPTGEVSPEAVEHLQEELGDLLFQVFFHAVLAAEKGWFDMAGVARVVHDKLVGRHPHVFGDAVAHTPEQVAARWEVLKQAEKGRTSVFEGIPAALPALALAAKLQRKAESIGVALPDLAQRLQQVGAAAATLPDTVSAEAASGETLEAVPATVAAVGEALFALADAARRLGVDPESALRAASTRFRAEVETLERQGSAAPPGSPPGSPAGSPAGSPPGSPAGSPPGSAAGSPAGSASGEVDPPTDLSG